MAFKLYSDNLVDRPLLCCDVCGKEIIDFWSDKATGTPSHDGQMSTVTVHHASCKQPEGSVTMPLIDFLRLFVVQNRIGDVGSNGEVDTAYVQYPMGGRFEVKV